MNIMQVEEFGKFPWDKVVIDFRGQTNNLWYNTGDLFPAAGPCSPYLKLTTSDFETPIHLQVHELWLIPPQLDAFIKQIGSIAKRELRDEIQKVLGLH